MIGEQRRDCWKKRREKGGGMESEEGQGAPPPGRHLQLFWRKKNIKFYFPATTEQNIARVNLFRKPSNSLILMAINALVAIHLIHLLW